jgi:hypothetical protein
MLHCAATSPAGAVIDFDGAQVSKGDDLRDRRALECDLVDLAEEREL